MDGMDGMDGWSHDTTPVTVTGRVAGAGCWVCCVGVFGIVYCRAISRGSGWDEMGWDGMGYDGMGWDTNGMVYE